MHHWVVLLALTGLTWVGMTCSAQSQSSVPFPQVRWEATQRLHAEEAHQAAASTSEFFFAISSTQVAKYDRKKGQKLAVSTGAATHLNSGLVSDGKLYLAHSNYPKMPERSDLKVLDIASMELSTAKEFGDFGGSLTWAIRQRDHWWCNFARYGKDNGQTFLVKFDDNWREQERWVYPPELIKKLGNYSLSGGVWRGELLHVTGHDDPVIFRLRLPSEGRVLQLVDEQAAPFTGQGIAVDAETGGLVGINRAKREIVLARAEIAAPQPRLARDQLLVARDSKGRTEPVNSVADWQRRRAEILVGMQSVMGQFPSGEKRCPLDVQLVEEVDCGTYVRRLLTYQSEPGSRVPAYLCVPKQLLGERKQQKVPAILCLHGTDNTIGHGTVVGLGRPNRQYASELAERGFVTIAPNYVLLAKYQPDVRGLGWESGTLKAVWDNMRAIDLVQQMDGVDQNAIGAIGHSLGGHNAVFTAVFDQRIKSVVSSCGLDSFLDYYDGNEASWAPEKGWCQLRYMPRLAEYRGRLAEIPFDFHELIGALAPRRVLIIAPLGDSNFRHASVDRVAAAAAPVFELHGVREHLKVLHPDCPHDFPPEMRNAAYQFFEDGLRSR